MKEKAPVIVRVLLGLIFVVFGLNGFLHFLPMPPMPAAAGKFMGGLGASGYFFPLLKGTEVIVGLLLISGFFVPLALVILAPITINIVAFHLFLAPAGIVMPIALLAFHLFLAWSYRSSYTEVLRAKATTD